MIEHNAGRIVIKLQQPCVFAEADEAITFCLK